MVKGIIGVLLGMIVLLIGGYTIMVIWNWWLTPVIHISLSLIAGFAIALILRIGTYDMDNARELDYTEMILYSAFEAVFPVVILIVVALLHFIFGI